MELDAYWSVIRRRWKVIAAVALAALIVSTGLALRGPNAYTATMRLAIGVVPDPRVGDFFKYDSYYSWISSEFLADDLSEILKSEAFGQDVSAELGYEVDAEQVADTARIRRTHRLLDVMITGSDPQQALQIAEAFERVINSKLGEYFAFLQVNNAQARIVNRPTVKRSSTLGAAALEIATRTAAALFLAVGLAFLLEFRDDRLRDRRQIESFLGAPVLGEIPAT